LVEETLLQLTLAESDEPRISDAMQLVLFCGCVQRVVDRQAIGKEDAVAAALAELLEGETHWRRAHAQRDCPRAGVAERHSARPLYEAWFRDFFTSRGTYAHGSLSPASAEM
jgi:hypothetical protein